MVGLGENAKFTCLSHSRSVWFFKDNFLPINARLINGTNLLIEKVEKYNDGSYECDGTTTEGELFHAQCFLLVKGN